MCASRCGRRNWETSDEELHELRKVRILLSPFGLLEPDRILFEEYGGPRLRLTPEGRASAAAVLEQLKVISDVDAEIWEQADGLEVHPLLLVATAAVAGVLAEDSPVSDGDTMMSLYWLVNDRYEELCEVADEARMESDGHGPRLLGDPATIRSAKA